MDYNFRISPRVLAHLGEDLIRSESIALFELIKNSYDACATNCLVDFYFENNALCSLTIEDDGFGMDKSIIEDYWLVVGTDYKRKNLNKNQCGRIPLGEKGIGRLGIHKLGNSIKIYSKKENAKEVEVTFDWGTLESAEKIEDFTVDIQENDSPVHFKNSTGTKIVIRELKSISSYDRRQLREIYRNITSLNSPLGKTNESFSVIADSNNDLFKGLPSFEEIIESALYFGHCKMEGNKITEFEYKFEPWDELQKVDKGRKVSLNDLNLEDKIISGSDNVAINLETHGIGPIEFDIAIFETDAQIFSFNNTEKKTLNDYLKSNGGIRVYRDGVRVYNYGERDNDWLGIDLKRVGKIGGNVSNNIIIGAVKIDREKSQKLTEKTNREGFIENNSYEIFVDAVDYALSLIVRERNVDKSFLSTLYKKHKTIEPVLSDLDEVVDLVEKKIDDPKIKGDILTYLHRINNQYKEVKEVLIKSANAGLNLGVVIHEIEKLISQLVGFIERNDNSRAINISLMLEKIIHGYSAMLKKSSIRDTFLNSIVETALDNYEFRFSDHKIQVLSNHKESKLKAYLASSEAISIVTNLLDNSIYWLSYARKENRIISVYLTEEFKGYNSIIISDNGPGFNIPADVAIKPFMTGKPHSIGSGLGLHVANEMMKSMKGKILFIGDKNEISFPKHVKENKATNAIICLCFPIEKK